MIDPTGDWIEIWRLMRRVGIDVENVPPLPVFGIRSKQDGWGFILVPAGDPVKDRWLDQEIGL